MTPLATAAFAAMGATSKSGISRPFDRRRDGFVMGEGAGVLVLEDAEAAARAAPAILGDVRGYGATADAHHLTAPEPSGDGAARAITRRSPTPRSSPATSHYVNAHGTSTPLNDRSETEAIKTALGERAAGSRSPRPSPRSGTCSAPPAPSRRSRRCWRCATEWRRRRSTTRSPTRARPRLRARRGAARSRRERHGPPSGSRTPSGSADTTPCSASRRPHERCCAETAGAGARATRPRSSGWRRSATPAR